MANKKLALYSLKEYPSIIRGYSIICPECKQGMSIDDKDNHRAIINNLSYRERKGKLFIEFPKQIVLVCACGHKYVFETKLV